MEQVADETWVCVCATYSGGSVVENLKIYLDGVVCTYTDSSTGGSYSQMTNGTANSWVGFNGVDTYAEGAYFGDLFLFNRELTVNKALTMYNGEGCAEH